MAAGIPLERRLALLGLPSEPPTIHDILQEAGGYDLWALLVRQVESGNHRVRFSDEKREALRVELRAALPTEELRLQSDELAEADENNADAREEAAYRLGLEVGLNFKGGSDAAR